MELITRSKENCIIALSVYLETLAYPSTQTTTALTGAEVLGVWEKFHVETLASSHPGEKHQAGIGTTCWQPGWALRLKQWATGRGEKEGKVRDTKVDSWELWTQMQRQRARYTAPVCQGMVEGQWHSTAWWASSWPQLQSQTLLLFHRNNLVKSPGK